MPDSSGTRACACFLSTKEETASSAPAGVRLPWSSWFASSQPQEVGYLHRNLHSLGGNLGRPLPREVLASSTSRGLAPREGLVLIVFKAGCIRTSKEPRRGPQAGKSGYPASQNADSSPRAQGALGLGFEAKPKGKGEALWAPTAYGPGRRVALDGTWASPCQDPDPKSHQPSM